MADGQMNQPNQGWQGGRSIGTGEGEVPLAAPTQNVTARTMASDRSSIQSSGGGQPRPYVPPPAPAPQPITPVRPPSNPTPPPYIPPRPTPPPPPPQPIQPMARPPVPPQTQKPNVAAAPKPKSSKKGVLVALVIALILIALAALGYFVVFPLLNQPVEGPSAENVLPETPVVPPAEETPVVPEQPVPPVGSVVPHVSFFTIPADIVETVALSENSLTTLKNSFTFDTAEVPILRELVFSDTQGQALSPVSVVSTIDPSIFTPPIVAQLALDATVFSFTDTKGTWLGFVLEARDAASLPTLAMSLQSIESGYPLGNYFLIDPGTPSSWRDGQASGLATRYLTFTQPGAALNYGWVGTKFVVAASYDAFKEALRRLQ